MAGWWTPRQSRERSAYRATAYTPTRPSWAASASATDRAAGLGSTSTTRSQPGPLAPRAVDRVRAKLLHSGRFHVEPDRREWAAESSCCPYEALRARQTPAGSVREVRPVTWRRACLVRPRLPRRRVGAGLLRGHRGNAGPCASERRADLARLGRRRWSGCRVAQPVRPGSTARAREGFGVPDRARADLWPRLAPKHF